ncbi:hypothetical protein KQ693_05955 [Thermus sp. PS18]|uniref:hypothetical protein n=1 Tax=Thermus sp. PS18 TaxID=2849039 RepID=UPI002263D9CD|nr:hypothetical protein [Thermus sp. PS18]UZX16573.1 hypothetical protein KQ693_05955 [Thermus sp. PS18]
MSYADALFLVGVEIARAVITAYSVYALVVVLGGVLARLPTRWEERVEALGGALYLAGVMLWRSYAGGDTYDLDLFLRATGTALLILPRLVRVVLREYG